jgi:glycosyltransferase involved in cell wall biosynthesis
MLDPYSLGVKAMRKRLYLALREGRNLREASRLIFTTPLEEQLARASLPWLGGGDVIPLGADAPPGGVSRGELAATFFDRFPAARGRRNLTFLGRLHPKKGLERIFAALPRITAAFPDVLLIIAGSGDPAYVSSLQETARQQGAASHVLFTGLLQGLEKWGALAAAEAFLLPSHQENFAIAAAEAMHAGLPLILSDKVNIWPFVTKAKAGIVLNEPDIERELEDAAIAVLKAPEDSRAMGARGESFARENFTWTSSARLTHELYERLLGAPLADKRLAGKGAPYAA